MKRKTTATRKHGIESEQNFRKTAEMPVIKEVGSIDTE